MKEDELQFFDRMPQGLPLYERFKARLDECVGEYSVKVSKTQISFSNVHIFACVSLPVRKIKGWPEHCIIVTLGLDRMLRHERIAHAVEPYPGRFTHHIVVADETEIDAQLMEWVKEAYDFSVIKSMAHRKANR